MKIDDLPVETRDVRVQRHAEDGALFRTRRHQRISRGLISYMNLIANNILDEAAALGVPVKLDLGQLPIVADFEEHEASVILDPLGAKMGIVERDAAEGLDRIDPNLG